MTAQQCEEEQQQQQDLIAAALLQRCRSLSLCVWLAVWLVVALCRAIPDLIRSDPATVKLLGGQLVRVCVLRIGETEPLARFLWRTH